MSITRYCIKICLSIKPCFDYNDQECTSDSYIYSCKYLSKQYIYKRHTNSQHVYISIDAYKYIVAYFIIDESVHHSQG